MAALLDRPILQPDDARAWRLFTLLHNARSYTSLSMPVSIGERVEMIPRTVPMPLQLSEIASAIALLQIEDDDQIESLVEIITGLDNAYLMAISSKERSDDRGDTKANDRRKLGGSRQR